MNLANQLTLKGDSLEVLALDAVGGLVLDHTGPTLLRVIGDELHALLIHGHVLSHSVEARGETLLVVGVAYVSELSNALVEHLRTLRRVFKQTLAHVLLGGRR